MAKERYIEQPDYNSSRILEIPGVGNAIVEIRNGKSRLFGFVENDIAYEYIFNMKPVKVGEVKYR